MNTNGNIIKNKEKKESKETNKQKKETNKKSENIEEIYEKIGKHNIIMFAFEDCLTLINLLTRDDEIKILANNIKEKLNIKNILSCYKKAQDKVESIETIDIKIDKIYTELAIKLKDKINQKTNQKASEIIDKIREEEQNIYDEFTIKNSYIFLAYEYAKENNKKIYVINNTMYDNLLLNKILERLEISGYLDIIEYNKINEFDSVNTLYVIPKKDEYKIGEYSKNKLRLHLYVSPLYNEEVQDEILKNNIKTASLNERIMKAIQYNKIYCGEKVEYFEEFGAKYISPIYYYFVNWLYENTNNLDNLYFLSRDGYIPEKIYKKFIEKRGGNIFTKYIYTSRKAYQIPGLILVDEEKAIKTVTEWNMQLNEKITLRDILKNCSLEPTKEILEIAEKYNLKDIDKNITLKTVSIVREFLKEIYPNIKEKLLNRYVLTKAYLLEQGVQEFNTINIMDIGWRGSVQNYISKILNKDTYGYYFGTMITEYKEIRNKMKGCFSNKFMPIGRSEFILDNIMMFEIIFSAPYPALTGFEKTADGSIKPVFSNKENKNANEIISKFQNSAIEIINEYLKYDKYLKNITIKESLKYYKKFLINKDYEDIIEFRKLTTNIGYGEKQQSYVLEATKKDVIKNEKKILEDSNFSFWKGAIYIEGIESKVELEKFKEKYNLKLKRNKFTSNRIIRSILITFKNAKKSTKK